MATSPYLICSRNRPTTCLCSQYFHTN